MIFILLFTIIITIILYQSVFAKSDIRISGLSFDQILGNCYDKCIYQVPRMATDTFLKLIPHSTLYKYKSLLYPRISTNSETPQKTSQQIKSKLELLTGTNGISLFMRNDSVNNINLAFQYLPLL